MNYIITAYSRAHRRAYPVGSMILRHDQEDQTILTIAKEYRCEFATAIALEPGMQHWQGDIVKDLRSSRVIIAWRPLTTGK